MALSSAEPAAHRRSRWMAVLGPAALLVLATVAIYGPALHGGVLIDDPDHITRPGWRSLGGLARIWFEVGITSQYFPLLHSAFWFEHRLWGDAVVGYHLVNVLQHAASACLVVAIVRRLRLPGAWLAGFVFAFHPVCVESVAWISEQKNTLSTLFFLAAGYVYLRFDRDRRASTYAIASALFVCALLTKSITATLAPALLVVCWWQRGRVEWRRDVRPLVPWVFVGVAIGIFTAWYERVYAHAQGASFAFGPVDRALIAGRALVFYVRTLLWPANLTFINPRWTIDPASWWQYAFPAAVLGVLIVLAWLARRTRGPLAAALLYGGLLLPTIGFLNINWFNYSFVADHFQYLASVGLIVPVCAWLTAAAQRWLAPRAAWLPAVFGAALVAVLGALSWRQSGYYRDAETLYRHTLARNPSAWIAHHNLAVTLIEAGKLDEAVTHLLEVVRLKPNHLHAYTNLGFAFSRMPGHAADAIRAYEMSLSLKPDDPQVLASLGHALVDARRIDDAISAYRRSLQFEPRSWQTHVWLAHALVMKRGALPDAIAEYETAIRLRPDLAALYEELAEALVNAGRPADAIVAFQNVVRLQPDNADAHYNLGSLLADVPGRTADAVAQFETAVRLRPDDPATHNNLALALMDLGRRDEAIEHLRTAVRLAPDSAKAHFSLGQALVTAPAGEPEALREFETAARLQPDWDAAQHAVAELRARARLRASVGH